MHPYKRSERLNQLIKEEIADIIMRRLKDPRLEFVPVTEVSLTPDMKLARVYISVIDDAKRAETIEILNKAAGLFKAELRKRLSVKVIPAVEFREDRSAEYGEKIDALLRGIK